MNKEIKYFYFFRGSLITHVHFYKYWVDAARKKGLPIEMITILDMRSYLDQHDLVKKYRKKNVHIYCGTFGKLNQVFIFIYFFLQCIFYNRVVVYLKKQPTTVFDKLKRIFPNRLRYAFELEGDPESEMDYLMNHPYKEGFYKNEIRSLEKSIREQEQQIRNSDGLFVVTQRFKNLLIERYPELDLEWKISIVPISFDKKETYFSSEARDEIREKLGLENKFVITYIGNAYYSWQNVFRTIEIYKLIKDKVTKNTFLLLLIRRKDHDIVKEFIEDLNIMRGEYILTQVDHKEILKYLSASDIGMLLRHKHTMNEVVTSGKIVDYLAAGLPVLTTKVVAVYPDEINKHGYGIILNDMDDDDEIIQKITPFLGFNREKRAEICNWARRKFSTDVYAQEYVDALLKLAATE